MPKKDGMMTPQEQAFVAAYAESGNPQRAAIEAGYAQPRSQGYKALARPDVTNAIADQLTRLHTSLMPLSVTALERLLTNPKTPAGAVVQAAKIVLDRTLGAVEDSASKAPHEMTGDELARQLDRLRKEVADRSRPVIDAQPKGSVLD